MEYNSERMHRDLFEHGDVIEIKALSKVEAEAYADELRAKNPGLAIDWSYVGGRAVFKALALDKRTTKILAVEVSTVGELKRLLEPFHEEAELLRSVSVTYHVDLRRGSKIRIRED